MSSHQHRQHALRRDPVASGIAAAGAPGVSHRDQYVHYSHELPEASAEAASRALVRLVPLAYGILLGGLSGHVALGLIGGVAVAAIIDLRLAGHSLVRTAAGGIYRYGCPAVVAAAHGLAGVVRRRGRVPPGWLEAVRCRPA